MTLDEIKAVVNPYIDGHVKFEIKIEPLHEITGRKIYGTLIKNHVSEKHGVYLWVNNSTMEIIYIGRAGSMQTDGTLKSQTLPGRLTNVRRNNISTHTCLGSFMKANNISSVSCCVMYSKEDEPPAYIEALMLYHFYKKNKRLPKLNDSY